MILTCPACGTQYVVKDGAIPPGGRQVRCASCRHSWHQDPEATDGDDHAPVEDGAELPSNPVDTAPEAVDDPAPDLPVEIVNPGEQPMAQAAADEPEAAAADTAVSQQGYAEPPLESVAADESDDFTPFAAHDDEPKRRGAGFAIVIAIALIVIAAIAFWYLAPAAWKDRVGLGEQHATPLQLMMTHSDRQRLESGNELLAISGRVINPTATRQTVPPITAQLRDTKGKLVYSWTIAPPAPSLQGGGSASFYSAEVNVPAGGDELTVTLGTPKKAG